MSKRKKGIKTEVRMLTNEEMAKYTENRPYAEAEIDHDVDVDKEANSKIKDYVQSLREEELSKINPAPEHNPKYDNVDINKANEEMLNKLKGVDKAKKDEDDTVVITGKKVEGLDGKIVMDGDIEIDKESLEEVVGKKIAVVGEGAKRINPADLEKMKEVAKDKVGKVKGDEDTVYDAKRDMVIHKRTSKDYKRIWKAFLAEEADDFKRIMGYGKKTIKRIGWKKFIDAMDWRDPSDVSKYKTDKFHVVVCPHCNIEFGVYEQNIGLCKKCQKYYDLDRFWETYKAVGNTDAREAQNMVSMFFLHKEFRENYRIKTTEERINAALAEDFTDIETFRFVLECLALAAHHKLSLNRFNEELCKLGNAFIKSKNDKDKYTEFVEWLLEGVEEKDGWPNDIMQKMKNKLEEKHRQEEEIKKRIEEKLQNKKTG